MVHQMFGLPFPIFLPHPAGAVIRTLDGAVIQVKDGRIEHSQPAARLGMSPGPIALLGDDRVLLAANNCGGLVSVPWPKRCGIDEG